ncbi:hypothetical protein [Brevibacterium oceani]|uniref:hypothetical protein n=1 Tax=Brevibacterium oceani TaxID=358099 RepID=UPI0015E6C455|nr:hypothetical protein [Brevibacterium oceani]
MASTESDESGAQAPGSRYQKRFVAAAKDDAGRPADDPETATSDAPEVADGPLMSPRAAISGVGMIALAAICFVVSSVLGGGDVSVSEETERTAFELKTRVTEAEVKADSLPEVDDAEASLSRVQVAANQVADLQNDYRLLTPASAASGSLDEDAVQSSLRTLIPLFAPGTDQAELRPWYLLAADADVPAGTGLPMGFDSGFRWEAQVPYGIEPDSTIEVTWLAVQTRTAEGEEPAVLAWATATYDMTRGTFSNVKQGTTTTGEALKLEVKGL